MRFVTLILLSLALTLGGAACAPAADDSGAEDAAAAPDEPATDPMADASSADRAGSGVEVDPIEHATFALEAGGKTLVFDPVGGADRFADESTPDLILITDVHPDHLDPATVAAIAGPETEIVAPSAVAEKLGEAERAKTTVLANGETATVAGVEVEAMPMYNTTEGRLDFHAKGRGNGYVVTVGGERVYVSGDTEDIPEMRALRDVDVAFVCMNLPYTMTVEQAADAVLAFAPKVVYPYHYRGTDGLSDVGHFAELVSANPAIEVRQLDWYPGGD